MIVYPLLLLLLLFLLLLLLLLLHTVPQGLAARGCGERDGGETKRGSGEAAPKRRRRCDRAVTARHVRGANRPLRHVRVAAAPRPGGCGGATPSAVRASAAPAGGGGSTGEEGARALERTMLQVLLVLLLLLSIRIHSLM